MPVTFFTEDTSFVPEETPDKKKWVHDVIHSYKKEEGEINYIFCSDDYLLKINQEHLQHDYYTDIITFDQSESDSLIEGDIFISVDRVKDNAASQGTQMRDELDRVMIHGVLHLIGFTDKSKEQKELMRKKEDECLSLRPKSK